MDSFASASTAETGTHQLGGDGSSKTPVDGEPRSLLLRAQELRTLLREEAFDADQNRRLSDRCAAALRQSGLLRLFTPRRFGGHEATPSTLLEVCSELARGCCSASWVASVLNAGNYVAAMFPDGVQREIWRDDPDTSVALVIVAPRAQVERVSDGVRITGEWLSARDDLEGWLGSKGWSVTKYSGADTHARSVAKIPACWVASATLERRPGDGD
ncbi:MAG: acyl-CoA dehydrogenase family protein [Polyangiaceae bacterium]